MEGPAPALPLPVALLRRRSVNAKTAKDRHDAACFAWEISVKLGVAAAPPADPTPLARGAFSPWAASLAGQERPWESREMLRLYALLAENGLGRRELPSSLPARVVLHAFEAYRVRVLWNDEAKSARFHDRAADILREGLDQAWRAGFFLQQQHGRLLYVAGREGDTGPSPRRRLFDLHSESPVLIDPQGTIVPEGVEPGRLYLHGVDDWRTLHPWFLYVPDEERAHTYALNGYRRHRAEYLDYATGEALRGERVEAHFPGLTAELDQLFARSGRARETTVPLVPETGGFGDYRILGQLGRGGMGVVLLARQKSLGRLVALKKLPRQHAEDPIMVGRFRREIAALSRCEHPNVVKILASGTDDGVPYYTMEFVQGADLAAISAAAAESRDFEKAVAIASERVRRGNEVLRAHIPEPASDPAPSEDRFMRAARLFRDAARGVHHLHEHGILHRDLKPGNIMVTADGRRAVIMDLGLAAVEDATTTLTRGEGEILGTLRYIAPELLQRHLFQADRRVDVYSLGATLYELITDRPIFDGDSAPRLIEQVLREEPPRPEKVNPKVPRDLSMIVRKAIEKDPRLRYDNAQELANDLDAFVGERPISARPPSLGYVFRLAVRRNRPLALTVAAALLVGIVGTALFIQQLRRTSERAEQERAQAEALVEFMLSDLRERLRDAGRLDLLETVARRAKEYYDSLPAGDVPNDTRARRAVALGELGVVLQNGGDVAAGMDAFHASLAEAERIEGGDPRAAKLRFSAHRLLGDGYRLQGRGADARAAHEEAFRIADAADRTDRDWLRNLGVAHERLGRPEAAFECFKELAAAKPDDPWALFHLSGSYEHLGHRLVVDGRPAEALEAFRQAQEIAQRLVDGNPGNLLWKEILMASRMKIGDALHGLGETAAATRSYRAGRALARELAASSPGNLAHNRSLATLEERLGDMLWNEGKRREALDTYREALVLRAAHAERDRTNRVTLQALSRIHERLADRLLKEGDPEAALGHADQAVAIARGLVARDGEHRTWRLLLAGALERRGNIHAVRHAFADTKRHYEEALGALPADEPVRERIEGKLAGLDLRVSGRAPATAAESLALARICYLTREYGRSAEAYRAVLADAEQRPARLYDAACSAALAGDTEQALAWLGENIRRHRAALTTEADPAARRRHERHLEFARTLDPDLASLRETPAFRQLFE